MSKRFLLFSPTFLLLWASTSNDNTASGVRVAGDIFTAPAAVEGANCCDEGETEPPTTRGDHDEPPPLSKNAAKKLAYKEAKKLREHDARLKKQLERARSLRAKLPHTNIPPAAEYRNLASFTEKELLAVLEQNREFWAAFTSTAGPGSPSCSSGASAALLNTSAREAASDQHQIRSENEDDHEPPNDILRVPTAADVVGSFLGRCEDYHAKYAAQELALAYQIYRIISQSSASATSGVVDAIIDVGAGSGNLSLFLALLFDVPVRMVEMDSPREELCAECCILQSDSDTSTDEVATPTASAASRQKLRELLVRVPDTSIEGWELPEQGFRNVVVLGKHLCGPGTDAAIEFIRKNSDRVRGCAFATCCFNKIGPAADGFAEWHRDEVEVVDEEGGGATGVQLQARAALLYFMKVRSNYMLRAIRANLEPGNLSKMNTLSGDADVGPLLAHFAETQTPPQVEAQTAGSKLRRIMDMEVTGKTPPRAGFLVGRLR
eukprot:g13495.t1